MSNEKDLPSDPDTLMGGFLQKGGGDGNGIQIIVPRPSRLTEGDGVGREKGAGKGRRTRLAAFGLSPSIIAEGDPEYGACLYQANKYRKTRMKELASLHGHVSAGAGALLASASLALAASRFLYQRAAQGGDEHESASGYLKTAAKLADSARQSELAAWEMSAKEGVLKRRQELSSAGQPWLLTVDGNDKKKTGRKTNLERQADAANVYAAAEVDVEEEVPDV